MDISKFNTELGTKIAIAKVCERNNEIKNAIRLWIEVTEMIISTSKRADLDFKYKHMLITKTQEILSHIKYLKSPPKTKVVPKEIMPQEETISVEKPLEEIKEERSIIKKAEPPSKSNEEEKPSVFADDNWMEKVKETEPSKGVVEITATKNFKIITPHDDQHVEKMKKLSEEIDAKNQTNGPKDFCPQCGAVLPPNIKICQDCGSELLK